MYGVPLNRGRLFFIGAESYDYVQDRATDNSEGTLDSWGLTEMACISTVVALWCSGEICSHADVSLHMCTVYLYQH